MKGSTSEEIANMHQRRDEQDRIRYQQNKHQVGMRPPVPIVSARGVSLTTSPSSSNADTTENTNVGFSQPFDKKDATQPPMADQKTSDDEIDFEATSAAIIDAVRTIGTHFQANSKEKSELAKLMGMTTGSADLSPPILSKLNVGLLLVIIVLCVMLFRKRDNESLEG